jgi:uncharacterized protein (TIGR02217 family)
MSNAVFPSLPGLTFPIVRTPIWKTLIQTTQSGRELRAAQMSYPLYKWSLAFDVLRTASAFNELQQLIAFYNARSGSYDSFLYTDQDDNSVTDQSFGFGDGSTVAFQLTKGFGGYIEPVLATNVITNVKVNGTVTAAYTVNAMTGILTFTTAPASGATLTWTGTFYYQCRFLADSYDFSKLMSGLYEAKKLEFQSVKL